MSVQLRMQDHTNTTDQSANYVYYIFAPLLMAITLLTIISNAINVFIIVKYIKKCTSLNIAFLNISILNFFMVFNQTVEITLILQRGLPIFAQLCHLVLMINTVTSLGLGFVHLFLAWDRYKIALEPTAWIRNRQISLIYSAGLWIGVTILAVYNLIFYYEDIHGNINSCFVAVSLPNHSAYGIALQISYLIVLFGLSIPVYAFHTRTASILRKKERANYLQLKKSSRIITERPSKTGPERAITSILLIYTLHLSTQTPYYIYNILQHALSPDSNTPLPRIITTSLSFLTAISPLLMLSNDRYKRNIYHFLRWIGIVPKRKPTNVSDFSNSENLEPKKYPSNRAIFFSKSKDRANEYKASPDSSKEKKSKSRRLSKGSLNVVAENKPRVINYALKSSLVLSAAGHKTQLNNFFKDDKDQWLQEMYGDIESIF